MEADDPNFVMIEPEPTEENTVNILIIGETGVGKSTFINAFANYLKFDNLEEAERLNPFVLIPCKFTVTDENYELREVEIGSDKNEHNKLGESSTQDPRPYMFTISNGEKFVRLIDTPGIGDTRGIDQDTVNCQKIIDYIEPLKVIHGIMFLLKPNSSKITVLFEFCLKQILSRLEKSASQNLMFIFTNTRGTCYRPGETLPCLRNLLEAISKRPPFVQIPLSKANIYCLDNEAFRYLAAVANGVLFTEREKQYFAESWEKSSEESWRMIIRIIGDEETKPIQPHQVEHTRSVNEARALINHLKQPMADITHLIQDKLRALQRQTELLNLDNLDIKDMMKNLVIPIIDIEVIELPQPVTVCTSGKCAKIYKVRDVDKWHYVQRCHNPCYLTNVPKEMIGAPDLVHCAAMDGSRTCKECSCDYSTHMHIYYESITVDKTIENDNVKKSITDKEELKRQKEQIISEMRKMMKELEDEHKAIIRHFAQFANFLQQNAITPYNDVYRQYIEFLIDRENSNGEAADKITIAYLKKCQEEYDEAMKLFENALNMKNQSVCNLTPELVQKSVNELFKLKHTGDKIKELYNSQILARKSENLNNGFQPIYSSRKDNKEIGLLGQIKNYFTRGNDKKGTESEEENSSYSVYNSRSNRRKNKASNRQKAPVKNFKADLKVMEQEAEQASRVLNAMSAMNKF
ncbi:hypothetical protein HHI36_016303 [Cryptolaemus montrouzieri]